MGSKHDQIIALENGVTIMNVSGYPKREPKASSEVYAQCVVNLLTDIMTPGGDVSFDNELIQEIWVTHEGQRHNSLYDEFSNNTSMQLK